MLRAVGGCHGGIEVEVSQRKVNLASLRYIHNHIHIHARVIMSRGATPCISSEYQTPFFTHLFVRVPLCLHCHATTSRIRTNQAALALAGCCYAPHVTNLHAMAHRAPSAIHVAVIFLRFAVLVLLRLRVAAFLLTREGYAQHASSP